MSKVLQDLIELRRRLGISQTEVGRRMGSTRQWVNNIERGKPANPSIGTLEKYAAALGTSIVILPVDVSTTAGA